MTLRRKLAIIALVLYTLVVSVLREFSDRNLTEFAEAHWVLDYRFGFVKRGLIGEIVSLVTSFLSIPVTAQFIYTVSVVALWIFCAVLALLSIRIVKQSAWSTGSVLAALVFLSSPFVISIYELIGYYDNIVVIMGVLSVVLLLKGKPWLGAWLLVVALFVHENTLVLAFAPFVWLGY